MQNSSIQYDMGGATFDPTQDVLKTQDQVVALTPAQSRLLKTLLSHPDGIVSRIEIERAMNYRNLSATSRALDVLTSNLRARLRLAGATGSIVAVRCYGYRYEGAFQPLSFTN